MATLAFSDQFLEVLASERRIAAEKCVSDNTQGPHVNGLAMTLFLHHLRRSIAERTRHCFQSIVLAIKGLGNTEVGQDKIRVIFRGHVNKVFRLQICSSQLTMSNCCGCYNWRIYLCVQHCCCGGSSRRQEPA